MSGRDGHDGVEDRVPSGAPDPSELDHDALDLYVQRHFSGEDAVLREIRRRADEAGMPRIQLPPATARAVHVLVRAAGARRVLEVGTLAGYSAVWIARALPSHGELITIEINADHAAVARESVEAAGLSDRVDIRVGDAVAVMSGLGPDGSFDVVFLDADKERYTTYLEMAAGLLRPGGLLMADNAFWAGRVLDPDSDELAAQLDRFNRVVSADTRFDATILPVGDGLLLAVRR
ncbi:MAG: O-methyltransferase [Gemmatimonadetes bacterium]|nr:O-methyltransferase [Gemmatimonadota bacterium]MCY3612052.1 O-methyltransferase [Gemmatimonadota bacterium]MCY3677582.1 O-methyltransferase [Gemmatimonadota bacterium]MYA40288.1 O-methyltransferase [Gemmatimonadota bacterium]MYE93664.1 O-methyltransferase [Gemmatimonadota bacterium]